MTQINALMADRLRAFAVFARHANLTRAAVELHIAQPSLHTKLAKLSAELGVTLYERSGRELVLTPEGEALAAFAGDQRRAAEDFLAALGIQSSHIRLATGRAALMWLLDRPLRQMVTSGVHVTVTPADRSEALRLVEAGAADVAAVAYDPPPSNLESLLLASVPQVVLVPRSHPFAKLESVSLSDFDGIGIIAPPRGRPHRESLERAFSAAGVRLDTASEADGWDTLVHLATLGVGAAIVNGCVDAPRSLVGTPVVDLPVVSYWLCWRPQRARLLASFLGEVRDDG